MSEKPSIATLGALKASGYQFKSVAEELKHNLLLAISNNQHVFEGVLDYEDTVIPELKRAILAKHHINFLGMRGQAKTRMARMMVELLDPWIPVIKGIPIPDDPLAPVLPQSKRLIEDLGDETPIDWMHRSDRYVEKLATPDVTVADLIGDIDPIAAARKGTGLGDEDALFFGLIPKANRCLFVLNELPDLQARIQVALFNILQEGDIQIRSFRFRLALDISFVFTANPEDYTNRGNLITPLKDRIGAQILTHYPRSLEAGMAITRQEAKISKELLERVSVPDWMFRLFEQVSFEARKSDLIDQRSGVSVRLSVSALEALYAQAELRMAMNGEKKTHMRITDMLAMVPAITGKVELVYEGEQEGRQTVAHTLINKAIRSCFTEIFPDPERMKRSKEGDVYAPLLAWYGQGNETDLDAMASDKDYKQSLEAVPGLRAFAEKYGRSQGEEALALMEFVLLGLAEFSRLGKHLRNQEIQLSDLLNAIMNSEEEDDFS